jgi:DNA-binding LytR/AlgR family response regulator
VRVHRSYIVNINKISKIERYGQKQLLQLTSGERLRVSANGYKALREKLNL